MRVVAPWGEYLISELDGTTLHFAHPSRFRAAPREQRIPKFDLDEYFARYKWEAPHEINILDIRYWGLDGYVWADTRFREEMAELVLGITNALATNLETSHAFT